MSGIAISYRAKLWIRRPIDLIDNTDHLPLLFHSRSSHSEPEQDATLSIIVSLTGVYFWMCVFSMLSRGVLLSWLWIRFFLSQCPHPITYFLEHVYPSVLFSSALPEAYENPVAAFMLQSWCNHRHGIEISHMILKAWTSFSLCVIWHLQSSHCYLSPSAVSFWPLQSRYNCSAFCIIYVCLYLF